MLSNWKEWCRLCAKTDGSNIDLFFKFESISDLTQIIQQYFNLSITNEEIVSKTICENCFDFLVKLKKFGDRCAKVNIMYTELLYEHMNSVLVENNFQEIRHKYNLDDEDKLENVNMKMINNQLVCAMNYENPNHQYGDCSNQTTSNNIDALMEDSKIDLANELHNFLNANVVTEQNQHQEQELVKKKKRKKSNEEFDLIKCDICEKEFTRKYSLVSHLKTVHGSKDVMYSCSKCPKKFTSKKNAKRHEIVHLPPELKLIYPCSYCDKKFSKTSSVQSHIKAIHHREKPFICEECGKSFCTKPALKEHQVVHSDEKPFACQYCPQKFKNLPRLKIHEQIHNDTKYICKECGLQLNTRQTLRMHMVVHSDVKTYKCQYCGNEYKRSKTLKNHLIVHTGLKPYVCPFCDKTFANGSNCRSHKKKAHPDELAAAEAAGYIPRVKDIPKLEQLQPKIISHNNVVQENVQ